MGYTRCLISEMSTEEKRKPAKEKIGCHFDKCSDFFEKTRPEQIEGLCTEIYKTLHPRAKKQPDFSGDGEYSSWYYSLPDFAQLIYQPEDYEKETIEESRQLIDALDDKIKALEFLSSSKDLSDFLNSETYRIMETSPELPKINKAVDDRLVHALGSLDAGLRVLKTESLNEVIKELRNQKYELQKVMNKLEAEEISTPLENIEIDVEYPVRLDGEKNDKRIDILLSKDNRKFAIIELKQWTEDSINVFLSDSEEEEQCLVNVLPGRRSQLHPAIKVRDFYKKALYQEKGEDAIIQCFVYLHNQLYNDSKLFRVYKDFDVNIYDDCSGPNNILYTRLWHKRLLKRLNDLFRDDL